MMHKKGYILPLTLMIISMSVLLVSAVIQRAFSYQRQARIMIDREQSRSLALGTLDLVLSRVNMVVDTEVKNEEKAKQNSSQELDDTMFQQWLLQFLPILNTWQTMELDSKTEFIDGSLSYYLSSEDGKINIDMLLKDQHKDEKEDQKGETDSSKNGKNEDKPKQPTAKPVPQKSALEVFEELVKKETQINLKQLLKEIKDKYKTSLEDVTGLALLPAFVPLKNDLFVEKNNQKSKLVYGTDFFTVVPHSGKINPLLLSASLKKALGFKDNKEVKITAQFVKPLKQKMNWKSDWDKVLGQLYGKKFESLDPQLAELFGSQFEATSFLVVVYARVGSVTTKIAAVLTRTEPPADLSPKSILYTVNKLYWL